MIYLDNAATTRMCDEAKESLIKYSFDEYFNPSAVYGKAIEVRKEVDKAREIIAKALRVNVDNIIFTSGGTEGNNTAIFGSCTNTAIGSIICSSCEHPAVYNGFLRLKQKGFNFIEIPCNPNGTVNEEEFEEIVKNNKVGFVSVMHVNNETGGINDILKLAKIYKRYNKDGVFHSDGVQAFMKKRVAIKDSDVDLYTFSAHKINGPKGVGAIYIKQPNKLTPILFGGGQEKGIRSGTENTAGIIAFSKAVSVWEQNGRKYIDTFAKYRDIIKNALEDIPDISYNTEFDHSSPHVMSLNVGGVKGEVLLHMLEQKGICIGRGSACSTKKTLPRALKALNITGEGTIRVSFGIFNTKEEIDYFALNLKESIYSLRKIMKG